MDFAQGLRTARPRVEARYREYGECSRTSASQNLLLIPPTHRANEYRKVADALRKLPPLRAGEVCTTDPLHRASTLSNRNLKRIRASRPGGTWRDWPRHLRADCHKEKTGKTYRSVYGRMEWDKPSPTITTQFYGFGNGRFGHPEQDRGISLREGAILQSFPNPEPLGEKPVSQFCDSSRGGYFEFVGR